MRKKRPVMFIDVGAKFGTNKNLFLDVLKYSKICKDESMIHYIPLRPKLCSMDREYWASNLDEYLTDNDDITIHR